MKTLQVFISSPGDVYEERTLANRVIERLQSEFIGRVVLEPVLWEHEPLVATSTFQHQIVKPSETDIVIAILWSRLGTRLPKEFTRPDGSRYESGTEYEFEEAIEGFRKNGKPDLLVYRKTAPPSVRLDDEQELMDRLAQKKKLDDFVDKWFHDRTEGTLKAAFHAFDAASDFETLLESHLYKLIERHLPKSVSATSEARAVWKKGSPFRGLHSFHFEHAPIFFGRTRAVSDILQALRAQAADDRSFVLVLGMSGGGKSSVARAGVLPMLTRPGVIEGVDHWRRAVFQPTDVRGNLFKGLATALLRDHALPSLDEDEGGPDELAQIMEDSPRAAVSLIKTALNREGSAAGAKKETRLALVINQMEELFTQEDVLPKQRRAFMKLVDALARCGRVWIVATLRSDFYPRLRDLPEIGALKEGNGQYDLMPPTANEIGQMIRLPTRAAGLKFEEDPASNERLDDMLRDAAASHPEILPLLQFTLEELYQRRTEDGMLTLDAYRELGGVEGSLAHRAETVFKDLPDDVEDELPKVLNELVSIDHEGHETIGRKRAHLTESTTPKMRELIDTFVENRLFVTELDDDGGVVVTVAHEALLWHWPRVKDWVQQNRENLRIRSRIAQAAERWEAEGRSSDLLLPTGKPLVEAESLLEQEIDLHDDESAFIAASVSRAKNLQRLKAGIVAALAILGVVAGWSAFVATQQRDIADQARAQAEVEAETAQQTTDFMVGLFEVSDPSEALGNLITAREILDRGAERIESELSTQPAIQATLMKTMGAVYTSLGLYEQAVGLLETALDLGRDIYGDRHLEIAHTEAALGNVLMLKADYETARGYFESALDIRKELLGDEHVDTARSVYDFADFLGRMGEFAAAEPLLRDALATQRRLLGDTNPEVAQTLESLALNLYDQGKYDEPVPIMREAVSMRRQLHGETHPDLAEAVNNLGFLLGEIGEYRESEQLFREALAMKRVIFRGEPHPEVAMGLNNVAFALQDQGNLDEAENLYREAIAMQIDVYGLEHPDVALALNNLSFLLYEKGELERSINMARQALDMFRTTLGDDHPSVARGMANMSIWMMEAGDYEAAEPLIRESIDRRRRLLGNEHADVAMSLTLLSIWLIENEQFEEAHRVAVEAKSICLPALGESHWRTVSAASAEGAALAGLGRLNEAEPLLVNGHAALTGDDGALPFIVDSTTRWLADFYESTGQTSEAERVRATVDDSTGE